MSTFTDAVFDIIDIDPSQIHGSNFSNDNFPPVVLLEMQPETT